LARIVFDVNDKQREFGFYVLPAAFRALNFRRLIFGFRCGFFIFFY
jgi:hypothetical protein